MRIATGITIGAMLLATTTVGRAQSYGYATYNAVVTTSGSVNHSSGVQGASHTGTGTFDVTFSRPIGAACVVMTTVINSAPGYSTSFHKVGTTNIITVDTFSKTGVLANLAFNILVSCSS